MTYFDKMAKVTEDTKCLFCSVELLIFKDSFEISRHLSSIICQKSNLNQICHLKYADQNFQDIISTRAKVLLKKPFHIFKLPLTDQTGGSQILKKKIWIVREESKSSKRAMENINNSNSFVVASIHFGIRCIHW